MTTRRELAAQRDHARAVAERIADHRDNLAHQTWSLRRRNAALETDAAVADEVIRAQLRRVAELRVERDTARAAMDELAAEVEWLHTQLDGVLTPTGLATQPRDAAGRFTKTEVA